MGIAPCNHDNQKMHKSTPDALFKAKYAHPKTNLNTLDYHHARNCYFGKKFKKNDTNIYKTTHLRIWSSKSSHFTMDCIDLPPFNAFVYS